MHSHIVGGHVCKRGPLRCVGGEQGDALVMAQHTLCVIGLAHHMKRGCVGRTDLWDQTLHHQTGGLQRGQRIAQPLFVANRNQGFAAFFAERGSIGL